MPLTIFADDLTGACDTGALFTGPGPVAVAVAPGTADIARDVSVVDTESRSLPPAAAARRVREAFAGLPAPHRAGRIFKKIDSSFRGQVGAEVEALLGATGTLGALVCPAFPEQGRTVVDGILFINGRPVHTTAVGKDPDFRASTSDVRRILERQVTRAVQRLRLAQIRDRCGELARALARLGRALIVADAETEGDLERLADEALTCSPAPLLVGSAGLARAAAARLGYAGPRAALPTGPAWLIVAGSLHPATRSQLSALEASGICGARLDPDTLANEATIAALADALGSRGPAFLALEPPGKSPALADRLRAASVLSRVVAGVLARVRPDLLVLIGGETAVAVHRALNAPLIEVVGAPQPGLALGRLRGGFADGVPLLTKAGGFGPPDLFLALGLGAAARPRLRHHAR